MALATTYFPAKKTASVRDGELRLSKTNRLELFDCERASALGAVDWVVVDAKFRSLWATRMEVLVPFTLNNEVTLPADRPVAFLERPVSRLTAWRTASSTKSEDSTPHGTRRPAAAAQSEQKTGKTFLGSRALKRARLERTGTFTGPSRIELPPVEVPPAAAPAEAPTKNDEDDPFNVGDAPGFFPPRKEVRERDAHERFADERPTTPLLQEVLPGEAAGKREELKQRDDESDDGASVVFM